MHDLYFRGEQFSIARDLEVGAPVVGVIRDRFSHGFPFGRPIVYSNRPKNSAFLLFAPSESAIVCDFEQPKELAKTNLIKHPVRGLIGFSYDTFVN